MIDALGQLRDAFLVMVGNKQQPDLSTRQLAVLLLCATEAGPHTNRGLAAALGIPRTSVGRSLKQLVQLGLATRTTDPADQRSVNVAPTRAGRALERQLGLAMAEGGREKPRL